MRGPRQDTMGGKARSARSIGAYSGVAIFGYGVVVFEYK
jgi:hypothetical protein